MATDVMAKKRDMLALDEQVTENLRRIYRRTAEEPVPDRLLDLLARLRAQDGGGAPAGGNDGEEEP